MCRFCYDIVWRILNKHKLNQGFLDEKCQDHLLNSTLRVISISVIVLQIGSRGKTSKSANYLDRDLPDIPKSSRRQPIGEFMDSPTRDKPRRPRQKKSSKNKTTSDGSRQSRNSMASDLGEGSESPARNLPDIPKKSTRKTSKEVSSGGSRDSVKPRLRSQNLHLGAESPSHSMTKSRNKQRSLDEDADREKGNGREISQVLM